MSPSKEVISATAHGWAEAIDAGDWDRAATYLDAEVVVAGFKATPQDVIDKHKGVFACLQNHKATLDLLVIDDKASRAVQRQIWKGTLIAPFAGIEPTGNPVEWTEISFVEFSSAGKICAVIPMHDFEALSKGNSHVVPAAPKAAGQAPPPAELDLAEAYGRYIESINTRTMADFFPTFCQPEVVHNERKLTVDQYRGLCENAFETIEGVKFNVTTLVTDKENQRVAARIEFKGRPVKDFEGIPPTGADVNFAEHVIYQLDGGKISTVWSIVDLNAYRASLAG